MRMIRILGSFVVLVGLLAGSQAANGQVDQAFQTGLNPYASYQSGNIDSINLANRGLNVDIPLISYPQRGGKLNLNFVLHYENLGSWYDENCSTNPCSYTASGYWPMNGFLVIQAGSLGYTQASCVGVTNPNQEQCSVSVTTADGGGSTLYPTSPLNWESVDTAGYRLAGYKPGYTGGTFSDRQGITYPIGTGVYYVPGYPTPLFDNGLSSEPPAEMEDTNGNEITYNPTGTPAGWTDSMGRNIPLPGTTSMSVCPTAPLTPISAYKWNFPGVNGGTYSVTFCYVNVAYRMLFEDEGYVTGNLTELQSLLLPNGTSWNFQYTTDGNGDLAQITFPTGGTLSYTWAQMADSCVFHTYANARGVATRTLNANSADSSPSVWTYGSNPVVVTDPAGNDTVHTFTLLANSCPAYETTTQFYQGSHTSGTLLKTVNSTFTAIAPTLGGPGNAGQLASTNVVWPTTSNNENLTAYTHDTSVGFYNPVFSLYGVLQGTGPYTGSYGLVLTKQEYDYGTAPQHGALLRTTTTTYQALTNSNYLTNNLLDLPASVAVTGSGPGSTTTYAYDQTTPVSSGITTMHNLSPPAGTYRGNLTTLSRYLNTTGTYLSATSTNWDTGMVDVVTDPKTNPTKYGYSSTYVGALLTSVTNALNQTTTYTYDFNTGYLASTTDPNNKTTTYAYNDSLGRLTSANYPDNGQTSYTYNDALTAPTATATRLATPDPSITSVSTFDGLGRAFQTQITSVSSPMISYTKYDGLSRPYITYNPTGCNPPTTNCGESTWGFTTEVYDGLGRPTKATEQDGSVITTSYSGNTTTLTDEAGNQRKSQTDGLGRLTYVWESPSGFDFLTTYSYDALDDLVSVAENGSRSRTFVYDSLARLTRATNPESGTINYTYDADGNIQTRTDARGIITTNTYDALNRLTQRVYSDGTIQANFGYDASSGWGISLSNGVGRLTEQWTGTTSNPTATLFSYDPMGRVSFNIWCTPSYCPTATSSRFSTNYAYDLAGALTTFSNGLGVTFSYSIDGAGRTVKMTGINNPPQYPATLATVSGSTGFWPNGTLRAVTLGNGLTQTAVLNNRSQPCRLNVNSSGTALATCTAAIPSGSVQDYNYGLNFGTTDNGNITAWTATGQQMFTRSYTYDQLNRLSTMIDSATNQTCKGLSWVYDAWGNRTAQNVTSGTCASPQTPVNANNQLSVAGYTYDAAGNLTADGVHTYTYDAENRLTKVDGGSTATYIYDAVGRRLEKTTSTGYRDYLYDLAGNVAGEWNTSPLAHYAYMNGQLVAEYIASTTYFIHKDHLGSTRLITGVTQSLVDNMDYLPFGEQIAGSTSISHKFTSKERDSETSLDNFEARYMTSRLGRFMSPDPSGLSLADPTNPQQLNHYSYVGNNPLNATDPSGMCTIFTGGLTDQRDTGALADAAREVGGIVVAPFEGQSILGGLLDVAALDLAGPNASSEQFTDALNGIKYDPAGIQIVAWSGGAQVVSTAIESGSLGNVTTAPLNNVTEVIYLSPGLGPGGQLAFGSIAQSFHSTGVLDSLATTFSTLSGQAGSALPGASGHHFSEMWQALKATKGVAGANPVYFTKCTPINQWPLPYTNRVPNIPIPGAGWDTLQGAPCLPAEGNPNGCWFN